MRNLQNVVNWLHLSEEHVEQLGLSMLGEVSREEQVGIKYRYDQRTGQEIIVIPSEWLETNIVSTEFEKESFRSFDEELCRGKEDIGDVVEQCKNFNAEKELGDRNLHSQVEKEEEERQCRDIESKEQRKL